MTLFVLSYKQVDMLVLLCFGDLLLPPPWYHTTRPINLEAEPWSLGGSQFLGQKKFFGACGTNNFPQNLKWQNGW